MTTHNKDTRAAGREAHDTVVDPSPAAGAIDSRTTEPGDDSLCAAEPGSPRYRSEAEPMDVILKRIGRSKVNVPNSLEPGVARQVVHAPVTPYRPARSEAGIFVEPTRPPVSATAPPFDKEQRNAKTVSNEGPAAPWPRIIVALGAAVVLVAIIYVAFARSPATSEGQEMTAPRASAVDTVSHTATAAALAAPPASEAIEAAPSRAVRPPTEVTRPSRPAEPPSVVPAPARTRVPGTPPRNDTGPKPAEPSLLKDYAP